MQKSRAVSPKAACMQSPDDSESHPYRGNCGKR